MKAQEKIIYLFHSVFFLKLNVVKYSFNSYLYFYLFHK